MQIQSTKQYIDYILKWYRKVDGMIDFKNTVKDFDLSSFKYRPFGLPDEELHKRGLDLQSYSEEAKELYSFFEESDTETSAIANKLMNGRIDGVSWEEQTSLLANLDFVLCLHHWSKTKVVYDFNKEISQSIMESVKDIGDITMTCLRFLPVQAFCIKFPSIPFSDEAKAYMKSVRETGKDDENDAFHDCDIDETIEGAIFYRDADSGEFHYAMLFSKKRFLNEPAILNNSFSKESMDNPIKNILFDKTYLRDYEEAKRGHELFFGEILRVLIPHLLYLTAEGAEVPPVQTPTGKWAANPPTKKNIQQVEVGKDYRIRRRKFRQKYNASKSSGGKSGTGSMKAPHVRRAHYSRYWYGKRDSEDRQLRLKWIPETYIHADQMVNMNLVIVDME